MRVIGVIILLLQLCCDLSAQKEDYQWIFNWGRVKDTVNFPHLTASILDFKTLPPLGRNEVDLTLDFLECNASISDNNGDLLYYSNGQSVHGLNHQPVLGGDTINFSSKWDNLIWDDENGDFKPQGFRLVQGVGFIPQPNTDTTFMLYHNYENFDFGTQLGHFEFRLGKLYLNENGNHIIFSKDSIINEEITTSGKLTACKHANGRDWWLLQFSGSTVYTYLIDPHGIHLNYTQELPFDLRTIGNGQGKFSPDGRYFAINSRHRIDTSDGMDFMLANFDRCTGQLSNAQLKIMDSFNNVISNGLEFSPDNKLLYFTNNQNVFQIDLEADNPLETVMSVAQHDLESDCGREGRDNAFFGQLQLGPDNKIYVGRTTQCYHISIINHPNLRGEACDFQPNVVKLPTYTNGTIPNFNTYRLGPLDGSSCDTLGLDNNPVSRFWYEQDSLDFLTVQLWDVSYFRPESWSWTMGDGTTSTERHPLHSYAEKGVYEVCLEVSNENSSHTSCQTLYLGVSSTQEATHEIGLTLFPNPTEDYTRLVIQDYLPENGQLLVYSLRGDLVYSQKVRSGASMIDLSGLVPGAYVYEVRDGGEVLGSGKVLKL